LLGVACGGALLAASLILAEDLPRGRVLESVACAGRPGQSYALYLPQDYTAQRAWPILYCLDPDARGGLAVARFADAAEKTGFLVAGSNNSRNGPLEPAREAIEAMLADTHARLHIDDQRMYAAGFSGGARLALAWARNGSLAGVVASGAGFGESQIPDAIKFRIYAAAGVDDFNYHELYALSRELARRGVVHRFAQFDGGHDWLPAPLAAEALEFFGGRVPPKAAEDSRSERELAARYSRAVQELADAGNQRKLIGKWRAEGAEKADSDGRRLARQVLGGTAVRASEQGRELLDKKDYSAAARQWELAVLIEPDDAWVYYSLALAQAGAGNRKRAIEALEQAVAAGFRDGERLDRQPLFAPLRGDPRYTAIREQIR